MPRSKNSRRKLPPEFAASNKKAGLAPAFLLLIFIAHSLEECLQVEPRQPQILMQRELAARETIGVR